MLAVIVVLTAGWPLVSSTVAGHRPLAAGKAITVGPTTQDSGRVTVGRGWSVLTASSNPEQYYLFSRGALQLSVRYVSLPRSGEQGPLLRGMRQVLRIGNPGVRPGPPLAFVTADGSKGLMTVLYGPGRTGRAAVVAAPTRPFAIEMVLLGPPSAMRAIVAFGLPVLTSLRFSAAAR